MDKISGNLLVLLFISSLYSIPVESHAQRSFGVRWNVPDSPTEAVHQLAFFDSAGIRYLEIDTLASESVWEEISSRQFDVFVQIPVRFPVVQTFTDPDSILISTYRSFLNSYASRSVDAFGLFEYGQVDNRAFPDAVTSITEQLRNVLPSSLYYHDWQLDSNATDSLFDFKIVDLYVDSKFKDKPGSTLKGSHVFLYKPSESLFSSVKPVKWAIEKTSENKSILFFESEWLFSIRDHYPRIQSILYEYASQQEAVFPVPEENLPDQKQDHSWIVLALLLLWGSVAVLYSYEPMYRKSLLRYYFSHHFFVNDVMDRHLRSIMPGLIILLQHCIMGGIFLYVLSVLFVPGTGIQVLFHHLPLVEIFGNSYPAIFLLGVVITFFFHLICLGWLYLANVKINYLSQILILYTWPLQTNLLIITLMVTVMMAKGGPIVVIILSLLFIAIMITAFIVAAYDTGRYLNRYKAWFITGTIGLYIIILLGLFILEISNSYLTNVFRLAITIS